MKKKIILIIMLCVLATVLAGCCSSVTYESAAKPAYKDFGGYFNVIQEWHDDNMGACKILYADDTHVMYFYFDGNYTGGLAPLYNADGTVKIYEGE